MNGAATSELPDLLAAAEPVAHQAGARPCRSHLWQQASLGGADGDVVFFSLLEAECTGHAAAAGVEDLVVYLHSCEDLSFVLHAQERALMAVTLDQRSPRERR